MSEHEGLEDDVDVNMPVTVMVPVTQITAAIRAQLLKDARRMSNLFGPTAAQKKTPLASKPQPPGTQRVW